MPPHNWVMFWLFGYCDWCPVERASWIKVSNIALGFSACHWFCYWILSLCRCNIFLMCPSFCLCWLCGRCPLYLPLGWMLVCFLRGVGQISTCCSHTWSLLSVLGIWFWSVFWSVLCTSFYSQSRLAGICHSCHNYFGQSHVLLPPRVLFIFFFWPLLKTHNLLPFLDYYVWLGTVAEM